MTILPAATEASLEMVYRPRDAVAVRATLGPLRRGVGDPCVRFDEVGGVWLAFGTEAGPATLHLLGGVGGGRTAPGAASGAPSIDGVRGAVRVRAWGPGAALALERVPALLGAGDDWSELDTSSHTLLAQSRHRNPGLRLTRTGRVIDALVPAVIEQKITSTEAFRAWRILVTRHGDVAPGPHGGTLRVPPPAAVWRRVPSWEWHRAGVDPRRSKAAVSSAVVAPSLERSTARHPHGAEVWRLLRTVPGVGEWTAAETAQRSHGDPDAVSFGDYHLAKTVGVALCGEPVDDDALAELLEPWSGQRQRIVRLVLATGVGAERHGPRLTIQDHRGH
ncbi:MAG: DNA-3-methyladenine glycosylase 2 family protein [Herbiconiux sp.]|nr:DNA-3-methyladenine glycosylase 2 family protein [Herbiconiux sp.]